MPAPRVQPMIRLPTLGPLAADGEETLCRLRTGDTSGARSMGSGRGHSGNEVFVTLFQIEKDGVLYRAVWMPGRGRDRASLGTRDRKEAERLGQLLLAELLRQDELNAAGRLTLASLWDRYHLECPAFLDNKPNTRRDDEARVRILLAFFGEQCDVRSLSARDQAAYVTQRRAGGIRLSEKKVTRAVRARSAEMDLVPLHSMLSWATTVRLPNGSWMLDANPLAGVRRAREQNPLRPIAMWERFHATRTAMQHLAAEAETREGPAAQAERMRWAKMELALVLAEATGRRLGSIRHLRWEDVDFERGTIRWRAEHDKKAREWVVPVP